MVNTVSDSLDMSTASMQSTREDSTSPLDNSIMESPPTPPKESQYMNKPQDYQPLHTLPVIPAGQHQHQHHEDGEEEDIIIKEPSSLAFLKGHVRYFLKSALQFVFKDNNLPLLINLIYHLIAARALLNKPWRTVTRYLGIPPTPKPNSALKHQIEQTTSIAIDLFRTQGVFHLAMGALAALALKERRQSSERSALFVLTLSSVGQTWSHFNAYWKSSHQQYNLKALQEVGGSDLLVTLISSIALSKTARRTGRLI
ncbi:mitochondrial glycerol-3-phosphate dehydrogenase [Mucor velutinosus]|uniref:Mitochondrial glycerol-3-phosphate dehydrogenase n=1 Tax=Mucor velutinosus TaxID=708070 RepID=A0AAN7DQ29_9FUNG|nr:mitochondrial glycerol-3-phosphate dehydrogenase [Mucor velutinosus]